jgi:hypothetical protein
MIENWKMSNKERSPDVRRLFGQKNQGSYPDRPYRHSERQRPNEERSDELKLFSGNSTVTCFLNVLSQSVVEMCIMRDIF